MNNSPLDKEALFVKLNISHQSSGGCAGWDWLITKNATLINSINPTTEESLGTINACSKDQYELIIDKASRAALHWREVPAPMRGEIIRQIAEHLRHKKIELGTLISLEMGKSKQEGLGEVQEMIDMADFAVGQARMLYGKTMHSERPQHRMYEQWHPLGVIGAITPFNFPIAVWAWNAFIAVITGNVVVWKPSPKTPFCALAIQEICNQVMRANAVDGIFSLVITGDTALSQQLVDDTRIALISFTGSTHTGRIIGTQVAKRFGKSILELSGNNAIIVDETADLSMAVRAILFSAIGTSGQRCTTVRRVIIQETIYKKLLQQLISAYQQIKIGDPLENSVLMGPLIDHKAVENYQIALSRATNLGGEILQGGSLLPRPGFFVEPCIVAAENQWEIVQQETFAPILYVMSYQSFEQAIALQNQVHQGLSSALFTQNLQHAEYFLSVSGSDCGLANINIGTAGAEIGGAFGGEKETGGGREAGSDVWKFYMRRQTNTINWGNSLPLAQGIIFSNS